MYCFFEPWYYYKIVRNHSKLCLVTLYSFANRLLLIVSAVVGESYVLFDPVLAVKAPNRVKEIGVLIGDRGFDAGKDKFAMVIKLRKSINFRRKEAKKILPIALSIEIHRRRGFWWY